MRMRLWGLLTAGFLIAALSFSAAAQAASTPVNVEQQTPTPANAAPIYLGIRTTDSPQGTQVIEVVPGSPADAAGFKVGDVIDSVNGAAISDAKPLGTLLGQLSPGATATIVVTRSDNWTTLKVTLGQRPTVAALPATPAVPAGGVFLGVGLIDAGDGIRIARIAEGSPAEKAGLRVNDLIQSIDGQKIVSVGQVQAALSSKSAGQMLSIVVQRDTQSLTFTVTLDGRPAVAEPNVTGNVLFPQIGFTAALSTDGLTVLDVVAGSPAEQAGLKQGDRITMVDGQPITAATLGDALRKLSQSGSAALGVTRGDQRLVISINAPQSDEQPPYAPGAPRVRLGVAYEVVTESLAASKNLNTKDGALIIEVQPNSPAEQAGLKVGDVVTEVDGDKVDAKHTLAVRMVAYGPGDTLTLTVVRGSETLKIVVTLAARGVA